MRILLIEDDQLLGEAILSGLKQHHYAVDWLTDGEIALQALSNPTQKHALTQLSLILVFQNDPGLTFSRPFVNKASQLRFSTDCPQ